VPDIDKAMSTIPTTYAHLRRGKNGAATYGVTNATPNPMKMSPMTSASRGLISELGGAGQEGVKS
jgi:hypothetical protein